MANQKYGMTNWDEVEIKQGNANKGRRDLFMRLEQGPNPVRILTKPFEYLVHRYDPENPDKETGFGERILSSLAHGRDPLVDKGRKPKRRWLLGVIDRKTQSYKVLDISVSVFKGIQELVRDEDWGDPSQYDVDIKVDKNGGATGYYTVIAKPKKPLSAADLELKQQVDLDQLRDRCKPLTPEEVEEAIRKAEARHLAKKNGGKTNTRHDDDDEDFPAAAGSDSV